MSSDSKKRELLRAIHELNEYIHKNHPGLRVDVGSELRFGITTKPLLPLLGLMANVQVAYSNAAFGTNLTPIAPPESASHLKQQIQSVEKACMSQLIHQNFEVIDPAFKGRAVQQVYEGAGRLLVMDNLDDNEILSRVNVAQVVDKIRAKMMKPELRPAVPGEKTIVYVIGGTATGKSSGVAAVFDAYGLRRENTVEINVDDMKETIPEYQEVKDRGLTSSGLMLTDTSSSDLFHPIAKRIRETIMPEVYEGGYNIIMESTVNVRSPDDFTDLIKKVRKHQDMGFHVRFVFTEVDLETALNSVHRRNFDHSGRFITDAAARRSNMGSAEDFLPKFLDVLRVAGNDVVTVTKFDSRREFHIRDIERLAAEQQQLVSAAAPVNIGGIAATTHVMEHMHRLADLIDESGNGSLSKNGSDEVKLMSALVRTRAVAQKNETKTVLSYLSALFTESTTDVHSIVPPVRSRGDELIVFQAIDLPDTHRADILMETFNVSHNHTDDVSISMTAYANFIEDVEAESRLNWFAPLYKQASAATNSLLTTYYSFIEAALHTANRDETPGLFSSRSVLM